MALNHSTLFLSNQEPYVTVMFINLLKFFFRNILMSVSITYQIGTGQNEPRLGVEAGSLLLPIPSSSSISFIPLDFGSVNILGDSSSGSGVSFSQFLYLKWNVIQEWSPACVSPLKITGHLHFPLLSLSLG